MPTPIHDVYHPLYKNEDKFIILVTGGRGSGKSYEVARFIARLTFERGHKILFTRYTMTSADKSVIPEVVEKIETDGTSEYFVVNKNRIINKRTGSEIMFTGIHTSSGNQTAKLKSIHGLTTFIVDEAEEWRSSEEYDKLVLSIRKKGIQNRIIIVMNPSDEKHFVYEKYIKDTHELRVIDGVPVQISTHPNVLHIHTTYHDNARYLGDEMLREITNIRENNEEKYAHFIIGKWSVGQEGQIFKNYEVINDIPPYAKSRAIGLDFGYSNDPTAGVLCAVYENTLYVDELFYSTGMLSSVIIDELGKYIDLAVVADSADPRLIDEIRLGGNIDITAVVKGSGSVNAGISKMQEMKLCVTKRSSNILYELEHYVWQIDRDGRALNKPKDADNHAMDAIRYYVLRYLLGWETSQSDNDAYWGNF